MSLNKITAYQVINSMLHETVGMIPAEKRRSIIEEINNVGGGKKYSMKLVNELNDKGVEFFATNDNEDLAFYVLKTYLTESAAGLERGLVKGVKNGRKIKHVQNSTSKINNIGKKAARGSNAEKLGMTKSVYSQFIKALETDIIELKDPKNFKKIVKKWENYYTSHPDEFKKEAQLLKETFPGKLANASEQELMEFVSNGKALTERENKILESLKKAEKAKADRIKRLERAKKAQKQNANQAAGQTQPTGSQQAAPQQPTAVQTQSTGSQQAVPQQPTAVQNGNKPDEIEKLQKEVADLNKKIDELKTERSKQKETYRRLEMAGLLKRTGNGVLLVCASIVAAVGVAGAEAKFDNRGNNTAALIDKSEDGEELAYDNTDETNYDSYGVQYRYENPDNYILYNTQQ
jgi:hypothetical protein